MAFMGMFMIFFAVILVVLGVSAFIVFVCFLSSGLIMLGIRKKNKGIKDIRRPWYVIVLRVIGSIASLPIVLAIGICIYAGIANIVDKNTNLPRAVMSNDYVRAERILRRGADPDIRDRDGKTLLMCIVSHDAFAPDEGYDRYEYINDDSRSDEDDIEMMELLLEYGADINATVTDCGDESNHEYDENGWNSIYANSDHPCGNTPLIYAVRLNNADIVEFLIDNGADVNAANACGFTPILMCADLRLDDNGGPEIARILLNEGADPHAVTNFHQDITWLLMRNNPNGNELLEACIDSAL